MTNQCPFCGNYAYAAPVGDAYRLDCRYCEIQIEITKRAYAARCPNPVAVLEYIREKMKGSTRPRVDLADMKRVSPSPAETKTPEGDLLTTAAQAIGTTLGKIAVKAGIAKPPAPIAKAPGKVESRKLESKKKAPVAKEAAGAQRKTAPRRPSSKSAPLTKGKKSAPKHT